MPRRVQYDVNVNMTYELDKQTWDELVKGCDGDEDDAIEELMNDIDGEEIQGIYGRAWVCSVDEFSFMQEVKG